MFNNLSDFVYSIEGAVFLCAPDGLIAERNKQAHTFNAFNIVDDNNIFTMLEIEKRDSWAGIVYLMLVENIYKKSFVTINPIQIKEESYLLVIIRFASQEEDVKDYNLRLNTTSFIENSLKLVDDKLSKIEALIHSFKKRYSIRAKEYYSVVDQIIRCRNYFSSRYSLLEDIDSDQLSVFAPEMIDVAAFFEYFREAACEDFSVAYSAGTDIEFNIDIYLFCRSLNEIFSLYQDIFSNLEKVEIHIKANNTRKQVELKVVPLLSKEKSGGITKKTEISLPTSIRNIKLHGGNLKTEWQNSIPFVYLFFPYQQSKISVQPIKFVVIDSNLTDRSSVIETIRSIDRTIRIYQLNYIDLAIGSIKEINPEIVYIDPDIRLSRPPITIMKEIISRLNDRSIVITASKFWQDPKQKKELNKVVNTNNIEFIEKPCAALDISLSIKRSISTLEKLRFLDYTIENVQSDLYIDKLTGIFNRRYYDEFVERSAKATVEDQVPFTLLIVDIDFFKFYNDTYGHSVGDNILIKVADTIQNTLRSADTFCRYGGEEFVVMSTNTVYENALKIGEKLRKAIEKVDFGVKGKPGNENLTISVGVAEFLVHGENTEQLFSAADSALYKAKKSGRNKVVGYDKLALTA